MKIYHVHSVIVTIEKIIGYWRNCDIGLLTNSYQKFANSQQNRAYFVPVYESDGMGKYVQDSAAIPAQR